MDGAARPSADSGVCRRQRSLSKRPSGSHAGRAIRVDARRASISSVVGTSTSTEIDFEPALIRKNIAFNGVHRARS